MRLILPNHLRPRREKVFGDGPRIPLDRNAKARLWARAKAYNATHRQPRQHIGPITRTFMEVLKVLLWRFHNGQTGRCFPGYDRIAEAAGCHRDTAIEAAKALEAAGILTWVHRLARRRHWERDLLERWTPVLRVIRTSNGYRFWDDPGHESRKSENPARPLTQDVSSPETPTLNPDDPLQRALTSFGRSAGLLLPE